MTDLEPLFESSPNPRTRALLRAGLSEKPSATAAKHVALALGLAGATVTKGAAAVGAAGSASSGLFVGSVGAGVIAKWFAAGVLGGSIFLVGATAVRYELARRGAVPHGPSAATEAPDERRQSETSETGRAPDERRLDAERNERAAPVANPRALVVGAENERALPAPTPADASPDVHATGPLTRELACIEKARAALGEGDPRRALSELAHYHGVRSTGALDREAWILQIDAWLALGDRHRAAELARGYLARFPKDAHATRLGELAESRSGDR